MSKIIIIDDALIMRMRLKGTIEQAKHEVIGEAANGKEGVEICKALQPDIVTLDISMPELDGIGTLKQLLEHNERLKVIMVSAVGQKQVIIEALKIGAKDFIVKPFEPNKIIQTIHKVVGL